MRDEVEDCKMKTEIDIIDEGSIIHCPNLKHLLSTWEQDHKQAKLFFMKLGRVLMVGLALIFLGYFMIYPALMVLFGVL